MTYTVQFFRGDTLYHSKEYDLGLENAKQHAKFMCKPYKASSARVIDRKRKVIFEYTAQTSSEGEASQ